MDSNRIKSDRFMRDFDDFGSFLKYLRLRAGLGQHDLGLAVGYGEAQISRLEHNHRLPDLVMIQARFIPALGLEDQPEIREHLLELARQAHPKDEADEILSDEMGVLEAVPVVEGMDVVRPSVSETLTSLLLRQNAVLLYGFPGVGKSAIAASFIRTIYKSRPVFWHTVNRNDPSPFDSFIRQLALFLVSEGRMDAAIFTQPGGFPLNEGLPSLAEHLRVINPFICVDEFHHMRSLPPFEDLIDKSTCQFLLVSREKIEIRNVESLPLGGMSEGESRSLLQSIGLSLPDETLSKLHALTQGNPMLLRLASAHILQDPAQIDKFPKQLATQREIAAFLMGNALEGLPDSAVNLLSLISIFRQPVNLFDADLAERLREEGLVQDLNDAITTLQRRHFIENSSEARLHPLLQDHLDIALHARAGLFQQMHRIAAVHLQATTRNLLEPVYHFGQAAEIFEMLAHLQENILHLDATGQGEAAADLIASLLSRTRNTSTLSRANEVQLLALRGQLLMSGRRASESEADFRQALAIAIEGSLAPELRASVMLKLARFLLQRGKIPEANQLCDDVERIIASDSNPGLIAETLAVRCTLRLTQSRFDEASLLAEQALSLAEPLAHREFRLVAGVRTMTYNTLGIISHIRHDVPAALSHWRKADEAALLAGNLRTAFRIKGNIGGLYFDQGELDEARQTYEGILDAVQGIGDVFTLGKILNALGAIYHLLARPAEALEMLDRAKQLKRLIGDVQGEATTDNQRAQVLLAQGRTEEALQIMERLLKQTEETGEMRWRASYLDTLSMALLAQGDFSEAREYLQEALSLPGATSDPQLVTYLRNHLTLAWLGNSEATQAHIVFNNTEGILESGMVATESQLVDALLMASDGAQEASGRLSMIEKEAGHKGLFLYSNIARHVGQMLDAGKGISELIPIVMGTNLEE